MKTVAPTKTTVNSTAQRFARSRSPVETAPVFNPAAASTLPLQRKAACSCGGGCPACQSKPAIQTKLSISEPGDLYEQEADRVADQVMRMADPTLTKSSIDSTPTHALSIQRKCATCEDEEELQRKPNDSHHETPSSGLDRVAATLRQGGRPLDLTTRGYFEPRFGTDFSAVRVHTNSQAVESARSVNAHAYTVGHDVVFNNGQYAPQSDSGKRLLAHELTHVVQQRSAPAESIQRMCPPPEQLGDVEPPQPCIQDDPAFLAPDYFSTPLRFCFDSDNLIDEDADEANIQTLRTHVQRMLRDRSRSVHIHGYASSPGSREYNNTLACHRAAAIREMLDLPTTMPARARVILHSHGETTAFGEPLMENQRVVVSLDRPPPLEFIEEPELHIVGSAGPFAATSSCQPWETTMINSHLSDARAWIYDAEPLVSAYANGTSMTSSDSRVVEGALLANFHTINQAQVDTIATNMRALRVAINGALDISCRDPGVCRAPDTLGGAPYRMIAPGLSSAGFFYGDLGLCAPWFNSPYYLIRVSTILHEVAHARVGIGAANDIYEDVHASEYRALLPEEAIDNPDSYSAAVRQIYHRGAHGPNELEMPGEPPRAVSGGASP